VRQTAVGNGAAGIAWLASLDDVVADLERDWDITVGACRSGGTASLVADAVTGAGEPCVLKVPMPADFDGLGVLENEIRVLSIADGHGCVRLLRHDDGRRALLLEPLGRQLNDLGLPVDAQLEIICTALQQLWAITLGADSGLPTGAEKGVWLAEFITRLYDETSHPCPERVVERALTFAETRVAAFDIERAVLVHGDAHGWNTLEDRNGGFKFVDPDGLIADREYDLAIPMREFNDELLAGDALAIGQERSRLLSRLTDTDERAIWEWGFIERVSTGLLLEKEGHAQNAKDFLHVADRWTT